MIMPEMMDELDEAVWRDAEMVANAFRGALDGSPVPPCTATLGCLILAACLTKRANIVSRQSFIDMAAQIYDNANTVSVQ